MKANRTAAMSVTAFAMLLLILDAKNALVSAVAGIDICIRTVIPSLFPFFFLSAIINDRLLGANMRMLKPIAHLCKIPENSESLLVLGLIGGYPVGASGIGTAYRSGSLSKKQAIRMLSFCNNAGPAFIFGILSPILQQSFALWILWLINIGSAVLVAILLPDSEKGTVSIIHAPSITPAQAMQISIRNIACVCGWVVLFRIILGFGDRWFLWLLPKSIQVLITGLLELSNGCLALASLPTLGLRFVYSSLFLSFGGICVGMQTASVIGQLPMKQYWLGKILQTAISFTFAGIVQVFLYPEDYLDLTIPMLMAVVILISIALWKKAVAFPRKISYNREN